MKKIRGIRAMKPKASVVKASAETEDEFTADTVTTDKSEAKRKLMAFGWVALAFLSVGMVFFSSNTPHQTQVAEIGSTDYTATIPGKVAQKSDSAISTENRRKAANAGATYTVPATVSATHAASERELQKVQAQVEWVQLENDALKKQNMDILARLKSLEEAFVPTASLPPADATARKVMPDSTLPTRSFAWRDPSTPDVFENLPTIQQLKPITTDQAQTTPSPIPSPVPQMLANLAGRKDTSIRIRDLPPANSEDLNAGKHLDKAILMTDLRKASKTIIAPTTSKQTVNIAETTASITQTRFGIDLGGELTIDGIRARWSMLSERNSDMINGLDALMVTRDRGNNAVEFRLLAGPLANASEAVSLCNKLKGRGLDCEFSVYEGQRF